MLLTCCLLLVAIIVIFAVAKKRDNDIRDEFCRHFPSYWGEPPTASVRENFGWDTADEIGFVLA